VGFIQQAAGEQLVTDFPAITVALGRLAQQRDATVDYMKPKGTNLESAVGKPRDEDPMLARDMLDLD